MRAYIKLEKIDAENHREHQEKAKADFKVLQQERRNKKRKAPKIKPTAKAKKKEIILNSPISDAYNKTLDRKSAHEVLSVRAEKVLKEKNTAKKPVKRQRKSNRQGVGEAFLKSIARSVGSQLGRRVLRGILGSILK